MARRSGRRSKSSASSVAHARRRADVLPGVGRVCRRPPAGGWLVGGRQGVSATLVRSVPARRSTSTGWPGRLGVRVRSADRRSCDVLGASALIETYLPDPGLRPERSRLTSLPPHSRRALSASGARPSNATNEGLSAPRLSTRSPTPQGVSTRSIRPDSAPARPAAPRRRA